MMNKQHHDYEMVPYPKLRHMLAVTLRSAQRTPMIHGLIEVDVTRARKFLRDHKAKTFREIHYEIRAAQVKAVEQAWEGFRGFTFLPLVVFRCIWPIFWWMLGRSPQVQKKYGGTVGLTAIGLFGKGAGWEIPVANRTQITLGGIAERPGIVDGHIAIREYLCMTLSFDHTIIDGAPAARFIQLLKDLIESGYGLCESEAENVVPLLG